MGRRSRVKKEPRLAPKPSEEWDDETHALIGDRSLNIFATLAHHPKLMKRWMVFGNHVLAKSTLPARDRELLILRTGWNCRAPYEWGQHVAIARGIGVTDEEISLIAAGPEADGWDPFEACLLAAGDDAIVGGIASGPGCVRDEHPVVHTFGHAGERPAVENDRDPVAALARQRLQRREQPARGAVSIAPPPVGPAPDHVVAVDDEAP